MGAYTEIAELFKARDNPRAYSPMIGTVISLPELKIQCGDRILLEANDVIALFDLYEHTEHDGVINYTNMNKRVLILPMSDGTFAAIGVVVQEAER